MRRYSRAKPEAPEIYRYRCGGPWAHRFARTLSHEFRHGRATTLKCAHVSRRRCPAAGPIPVRIHDQLSFHLSRFHHRTREFPRGARGALAAHRQGALPRSLQVLVEDFCRGIRHGRGVRHRHVIPVRHQLGGFLRSRGPGDRPTDGLRSAHGLLPRGRLPRRDAVRHAEGGQATAFLRHPDGGHRNLHLGVLDTEREQLDADAGRLRDQRASAVRARRFVGGDHLQSELSLPAGAHRHCGLSHHRAGRRCRRRLAPAAQSGA